MGKGPSQGAKGRWVEGILGFTTWRLGDAPLGASGWRRICLTSGPAVLFLFHLPCAEAPLHLAGAAQASLRRRGTCLHRLAPPSLPVTRPAEVHLNRCTGFVTFTASPCDAWVRVRGMRCCVCVIKQSVPVPQCLLCFV